MSSKDVEITFAPYQANIANVPEASEERYKLTLAIRPKMVTTAQIVTEYKDPFVMITLMTDCNSAKAWVAEVVGGVIRVNVRGGKKCGTYTATIFMTVKDGSDSKKLPL
jgi:hypothetical protein